MVLFSAASMTDTSPKTAQFLLSLAWHGPCAIPGNDGRSTSQTEAIMDRETAALLRRLQDLLRIVRLRQRRRWRAKVCTVSYREDRMVANLSWYVSRLERRLKGRDERLR